MELLNGILAALESGDTDFTDEIAAYNAALEQQLPLLKDAINNETVAMQGVVKLLEE